jgi:hypothetical protein
MSAIQDLLSGTPYPINIIQRQDYELNLTLKTGTPLAVIDLTGATVQAQIRTDWDGALLGTFTATIPTPASSGVIKLVLSSAASEAIRPGDYKHDVFITRSGVKTRVLYGACKIGGAITR